MLVGIKNVIDKLKRFFKGKVKFGYQVKKGDIIYYVYDGLLSSFEVKNVSKKNWRTEKGYNFFNGSWIVSQHQFTENTGIASKRYGFVDGFNDRNEYITTDPDRAISILEEQIKEMDKPS